ncbi:hypothetical protein WN48_02094 [Eufriesea mexicana]|nr:hypothetical protein WN48_02094 [Eufriesea mexicana]
MLLTLVIKKKKKIMKDQVCVSQCAGAVKSLIRQAETGRYERLIATRKVKFCGDTRSRKRRKKNCKINACSDKVDVWVTFWYFSSSDTFI